MNENTFMTPELFERLIHILEFSVVLGIGVIVLITRKYSKNINKDLEEKIRLEDENYSSR